MSGTGFGLRIGLAPPGSARTRHRWRNYRRVRLHDVCHTHATLALAAGHNPKVVSERLGHWSVAFTLQTYAHVSPGMQDELAKDMSRLVATSQHRDP